MTTSFDVLQDHNNDTIKEACRAIKKPGGETWVARSPSSLWHASSSLLSGQGTCGGPQGRLMTRPTWPGPRLVSWRTRRPLRIASLTKRIPRALLCPLTCNRLPRLLGKMQGITGIPLVYIVWFILKSPNNSNFGDPTRDYLTTMQHQFKDQNILINHS